MFTKRWHAKILWSQLKYFKYKSSKVTQKVKTLKGHISILDFGMNCCCAF